MTAPPSTSRTGTWRYGRTTPGAARRRPRQHHGLHPGPSCTDGAGNWGLGWFNNPANPIYPVDRQRFNANDPFDTKNPQLWPYQEKVMGWAFTPVGRYNYIGGYWEPAYHAGRW